MTIKTYDICGKEGNVISAQLPMYRMFDSCDGRTWYEHPNVVIKPIDICPDCLRKCTNIYDERVMGYGKISISINPEIKEKENGTGKSH